MTIGHQLDNALEQLPTHSQNRIQAGLQLLIKIEKKRNQFEKSLLEEKDLIVHDIRHTIQEDKVLLNELF